tara:strand:+ start:452473 stop:453234 length:762 start_codon:yes stop_codon:yes gene_type:complete
MPIVGIIAVLIILLLISSIRIIKEYERGVIYTLGKYTGTRGAGIQIVIPALQVMVRVDVRIRTEDIPSQDVISKDNVSVRVNAVVYYRVVDPASAINRVEQFNRATSELAQTTLRSVLGMHELDDMLAHRERLNKDIQAILDTQTDGWGIKVTDVQIKHIDLDTTMVRAMAKQAEAERERRAKVINATGELQAAKELDQAAEILAQRPQTMQLRYLGTLGEFASSQSSTIVLPMPMELLGAVQDIAKMAGGKK